MTFALALLTMELQGADPADCGCYVVGVETRYIDEPNYDRRLRTEVWYPAKPTDAKPEGRYRNGIPSRAVRNSAPAEGRFPIVLFSHGLGGVREQSTFIAEHLASHGFIVASCDHPSNTGRDLNLLKFPDTLRERPLQVRTVLDELFRADGRAGDPLCGRCDLAHVAATGHSMGGYTSLVLGGAPARLARPAGSDAAYLELRAGDPRVRAVVALAPFTSPVFTSEGLAEIRVPVMILGGSLDDVTPVRVNQKRVFDALKCVKYLGVIEGATHFNFNDEEMLLTAPWIVRQKHRPKIDRKFADAAVRGMTLAFLDRHLRGGTQFDSVLERGREKVVWKTSQGGTSAEPDPRSPVVEASRR